MKGCSPLYFDGEMGIYNEFWSPALPYTWSQWWTVYASIVRYGLSLFVIWWAVGFDLMCSAGEPKLEVSLVRRMCAALIRGLSEPFRGSIASSCKFCANPSLRFHRRRRVRSYSAIEVLVMVLMWDWLYLMGCHCSLMSELWKLIVIDGLWWVSCLFWWA